MRGAIVAIFGGNTNSSDMGHATDVFDRPPRRKLPLSKGGDVVIDFLQTIDGLYVNYSSGVSVTLQIDATPPIAAPASISTYHAVCRVESAVADLIDND